jgi:hypothetical protein
VEEQPEAEARKANHAVFRNLAPETTKEEISSTSRCSSMPPVLVVAISWTVQLHEPLDPFCYQPATQATIGTQRRPRRWWYRLDSIR